MPNDEKLFEDCTVLCRYMTEEERKDLIRKSEMDCDVNTLLRMIKHLREALDWIDNHYSISGIIRSIDGHECKYISEIALYSTKNTLNQQPTGKE